MIVGNHESSAVTQAAVRTLIGSVVVVVEVVVGTTVVGVGTTVVVGVGGVGVDVVIGATNIRRPTRTNVEIFFARHKPVTGQRKTPDLPSAQSSWIPCDISVEFELQPRDVTTETMRVLFLGLREVLSQHKRGADFFADHFASVPLHVIFALSRVTVPFVLMHTRIVGTGEGAA